MAVREHHGHEHPKDPNAYDLQGEFGEYHASFYIGAAYFYKNNKAWCLAHPKEFWEKFFGGSDDDSDYYQPDYDLYGTKYGEDADEEESDDEDEGDDEDESDDEDEDGGDDEDEEEEDEVSPADEVIIKRYAKERKKFRTPLPNVNDPHPFTAYACPAFVIMVWDNIKHDPILVEGANFFLASDSY